MIQPAPLQKNDLVGIVAPGRKIDAAVLHAAITMVESWGLKVRVGKNLTGSGHSYLAGSDSERLADLQQMLNDSSMKAILCARGGYGTTRILDKLDFNVFLKNPKWICGFSDITSLHLKLQGLGVQSIHGTMPVLFSKPDSAFSVNALRNILFNEPVTMEANPRSKNRLGNAEGVLVGGNLSLVVDSLGTTSEVDTKNKILVIEEVDEYVYRIDRMLVQLKRAEKLQHLRGLVVGHMTDVKETEAPFGESIEDIVRNQVEEYDFPIGFGFPIGHENPNLPWIQGSVGKLTITEERALLTF